MRAPPPRFPPVLLLLAACSGRDTAPQTAPYADRPSASLAEVPLTATWSVDGLRCPATVVTVEAGIPHIYAQDRTDLARVFGFVQARDRFFSMDLARRLGLGQVSAILGQDALETDRESRSSGMTFVADRILADLGPDQLALLDAYAAGVNDYIAAVGAGSLPPPSELALAGGILGATSPTSLMRPFDRRDLAGVLAVLVYELGYETGDVGRERVMRTVEAGLYADDAPQAELRRLGVTADILAHVHPVLPRASAPGWGRNGAGAATPSWAPAGPRPVSADGAPAVNGALLSRLDARLDRLQHRLGRHGDRPWGSNAWAVGGALTADGTALLAGDGHLPLTVPSLFYAVGLDTSVLGGGTTHQTGLTIPGLPFMAVGTNGDIAWSQTQLMGDITDWYAEVIQLDGDGAPAATWFDGGWRPLSTALETIEVADVPLLGSEGRTEAFTRYTTFDGRFLADIEGTAVPVGTTPAPGTTVVVFGGGAVVPGDVDGDGVVSAVSFDYAAFDSSNLLRALDGMGHATDIASFRAATRGLVAYSQNLAAADATGAVYTSGWQAVPCRGYLPREASGAFLPGADPTRLLDGTRYGGFRIPMDAAQLPAEGDADPYACVVPFDDYPHAWDPPEGYVVTANNDPGGITLDDDLFNDPHYIGGPWVEGYRADTISREIERLAGQHSVETMAAIQANHESRLAQMFAPELLDAIALARAYRDDTGFEPGSPEERLADLYRLHGARFDEVEQRLGPWLAGGAIARSGVETFYHLPIPGEEDDAVATMLFNAWFPRYQQQVLDDEGLPGVWRPNGTTGRLRLLQAMLDGRGPGNPAALASTDPATGESAFFDILGTEIVERSHEVALLSLVDALDFLASAPTEDGRGGFGTDDMGAYLWGLKHQVTFDSVLAEFLGDDPTYSFLTDQFAITTDTLPLADALASDDPRAALLHFPRPGDNEAVDAADPGYGGTDFRYGSGPVFRLVVRLGPNGADGLDVLPGGQSALIDSPHFADQAALWLGNDALPLRFGLRAVLAGAVGREDFTPAAAAADCAGLAD